MASNDEAPRVDAATGNNAEGAPSAAASQPGHALSWGSPRLRLVLWHGAWAVAFAVATLLIHKGVNEGKAMILVTGVPSADDAPQGFVTPAFDVPETSVLNLSLHGAAVDPTALPANSTPNIVFEGALVEDGGTQSYGFALASALPDALADSTDRQAHPLVAEVRLSRIPKGRYVLRLKAQPGNDAAAQHALQLHVSLGGEGKTQPLIVLGLLLVPLVISLLRMLRAQPSTAGAQEMIHAH